MVITPQANENKLYDYFKVREFTRIEVPVAEGCSVTAQNSDLLCDGVVVDLNCRTLGPGEQEVTTPHRREQYNMTLTNRGVLDCGDVRLRNVHDFYCHGQFVCIVMDNCRILLTQIVPSPIPVVLRPRTFTPIFACNTASVVCALTSNCEIMLLHTSDLSGEWVEVDIARYGEVIEIGVFRGGVVTDLMKNHIIIIFKNSGIRELREVMTNATVSEPIEQGVLSISTLVSPIYKHSRVKLARSSE